jgi:hypothetical protein
MIVHKDGIEEAKQSETHRENLENKLRENIIE